MWHLKLQRFISVTSCCAHHLHPLSTMADPNLIDTSTHFNNATSAEESSLETSQNYTLIAILRMIIACLGIVSNITVVVAFLNHHKLRRKIPNIFIVNQVSEVFCNDRFLWKFKWPPKSAGFWWQNLANLGRIFRIEWPLEFQKMKTKTIKKIWIVHCR